MIRCEAGLTLAELLAVAVPAGWFPPVTPGTKFVTVGGAIANDVHGKNHHRDGTFGRFVRRFELWRSSGEKLVCSPDEHADLYRATIGGLGLTGLIRWAEIQLTPVANDQIDLRRERFASLDDFFRINAEANARSRYTVAWIDTTATGAKLGRGLYIEGDHAPGPPDGPPLPAPGEPMTPRVRVPFDAPGGLLNTATVRAFNALYYRQQLKPVVRKRTHFEPFFYPLDAIGDWNRLYGKRGFFQYQFVVPHTRWARRGPRNPRPDRALGAGIVPRRAQDVRRDRVARPAVVPAPRRHARARFPEPGRGARGGSSATSTRSCARRADGSTPPKTPA